jgi:hypothetical protein
MHADESGPTTSFSARFRPAATAIVRLLPDGSSVILDAESEKYFGLDDVGTAMWEQLNASDSLGEARDRLLSVFEVGPDRLERDLQEFVGQLVSRGLAVVEPAD